VFKWLEIFFEEDDEKLGERYAKCRSGEILCGECKMYLAEKIRKFLEKHQERREEAKELVRIFKYEGKLAREKWLEAGVKPV